MAASKPLKETDSKTDTDKDFELAYLLQYQEIATEKHKEKNREKSKEHVGKNITSNQLCDTEVDGPENDSYKGVECSDHKRTMAASKNRHQWRTVNYEAPSLIQNSDSSDVNLSQVSASDFPSDEDEAAYEIQQLLQSNTITAEQAENIRKNNSRKNVRRPSREHDKYYDSDDADDDVEMAKEIESLRQAGSITSNQAESILDNRKTLKQLNEDQTNPSDSGHIPYPFDKNGIPVNWSLRDFNNEASNSLFSIVELFPGDTEYDQIDQELTEAGIEITKLERLENTDLLHRYQSEIQHIKQRRPKEFKLNSRYLYHGTKVDKLRICEEGLDQRLSRMGFFGKGIYFSDNPLKCVHYAGSGDDLQESYILKCRVILGDSKVYKDGQYDTSLKREPEKETPTGGYRFYDSVVGCPKDFNEYVVYENRRAMIEYIITFKLKPDGARQLRQRPPSPTFTKQKTKALDSDMSDTEHFERIRQVRENIRKQRIEASGGSYTEPTEEQIKKDKAMWIRLQKLNGVPVDDDMAATLTNQDDNKMTRSHQSYNLSNQASDNTQITQGLSCDNNGKYDTFTADIDPVSQVMSSLIQDFLAVTSTSNVEDAKRYIEKAQMDLDHAIVMYYENLP